jgi:hypothetical protein
MVDRVNEIGIRVNQGTKMRAKFARGKIGIRVDQGNQNELGPGGTKNWDQGDQNVTRCLGLIKFTNCCQVG